MAERDELLAACADAAGVPVVVDAIEQASLQRAKIATGWPVLSWIGKLRRDPMSKLKIGDDAGEAVTVVPTAEWRAPRCPKPAPCSEHASMPRFARQSTR